MKIISTRVHGVLDYLVGVLLIAVPFILNFDDNAAAMWVPVIAGIGTIVYSLLTDYERGVYRIIPMRVHLTIDLVAGIFLATSPWIFGFADRVFLPHVAAGLFAIVVVVLSDRVPSVSTSHSGDANRSDTRIVH